MSTSTGRRTGEQRLPPAGPSRALLYLAAGSPPGGVPTRGGLVDRRARHSSRLYLASSSASAVRRSAQNFLRFSAAAFEGSFRCWSATWLFSLPLA